MPISKEKKAEYNKAFREKQKKKKAIIKEAYNIISVDEPIKNEVIPSVNEPLKSEEPVKAESQLCVDEDEYEDEDNEFTTLTEEDIEAMVQERLQEKLKAIKSDEKKTTPIKEEKIKESWNIWPQVQKALIASLIPGAVSFVIKIAGSTYTTHSLKQSQTQPPENTFTQSTTLPFQYGYS